MTSIYVTIGSVTTAGTDHRAPPPTAEPHLLAPQVRSSPIEAPALPQPPVVPVPPLLQMLRFNQRQIEFVFRARRELGEVFRMHGTLPGRPGRHQPPRPRPLALHGEARAGALADRRVAAAADRRPELGPHRDRPAPHAPAQTAAAALPRRGDRALHADDRRRCRARDRPLAARHARSPWRRACRRSRST